MHHQVGVGNAGVDLLDTVDRQDIAGGRPGELVGAVAGAAGNRQGVHSGGLYEPGGLLGIGQHLVVGQLALGADAVFLAGFAGFQGAQATQFTLHRDAAGVGTLHHLTGDGHVVVVIRGGLAVLAQGAVHHH